MELSTSLTIVSLIVLGGLAAAGIFFAMLFRKVVPTNEVHIVQSGKKSTNYGKGQESGNVYYKIPSWVPYFGIEVSTFSVSNFDIDLKAYEAFDSGRLPFVVDVKSFFRISNAEVAAQRVSSFQELVQQLEAVVQGAVRAVLASMTLDQIMAGRSTISEEFTKEVREGIANWGVETVKNIELMEIRDVKDSKVIHNIMSKKISEIDMQSRVTVAKNKKEAEEAEIEAKKEVDLKRQKVAEEVGLRTVETDKAVELARIEKEQSLLDKEKNTAEKEMEVVKTKALKQAEINKEAALIAAGEDKEVAVVEANKAKEVAEINAKKEKDVAKIGADKEKEVAVIKAEANYETKKKDAEAHFEAETKKADANLTVQKKTAEGNLEMANAEAKGIEAKGVAAAKAKEAEEMALVNPQITLSEKVGNNEKYQNYLIKLEEVKANRDIGIAQAEALSNADLKIIANTGNAQEGLKSFGELFSSNGGMKVGALLETLAATPVGKALLEKAGIEQ